jgi:ribosomal protein S18 acetylase RimI-like enzyme
MKIRKAKPSDLAGIQRLSHALFDYEDQFKHEYNLSWSYEAAGEKYFQKRLKSKKALVFVVEEKDRLIGYTIAFIDNFSYRKPNPICEIENIFIEDKYRQRGIGKALMEAVRKKAKSRHVKRLRVGAIAQNKSAIKFYHAQGFKDINLYLEEKL